MATMPDPGMGRTPVRLLDPADHLVIELPEQTQAEIDEDGVLIPMPGQVIDVTVPGLILRFGETQFLASVALSALAEAGQRAMAELPAIATVGECLAAMSPYLAAMPDD